MAKIYDLFYGPFLLKGLGMAFRAMKIEPGLKILEVGIGTGITLERYPHDVQVVGIDLSAEMLEQARLKIKNLELKNIELKQMSAEKLEFADASFDRVFAPSVISVVSEPRRVVDEMIRVCKPGGLVCIVSHFAGETGPTRLIDRVLTPVTQGLLGFHMDTSRNVYLKRAGVEVVSVEKTLKPNFSDVIVLRRL
ncbi:MAG: class I SAM-dependent methyltransferase [Bdellovibrionales bacterium]